MVNHVAYVFVIPKTVVFSVGSIQTACCKSSGPLNRFDAMKIGMSNPFYIQKRGLNREMGKIKGDR